MGIVWLVSTAALVTGFSIVIVGDVIRLKEELVNTTRLDAGLIGEFCSFPLSWGDKEGARNILRSLRGSPKIVEGIAFDANDSLFARYPEAISNEIQRILEPNRDAFQFKGNYLHVTRPIIHNDDKKGTIYLIASTKSLDTRIRQRVGSMVGLMIGLVVLSYILALRLQSMISKPILKLAAVTETISKESDFSVRVKKTGDDEIGTLYDGFNNMLDQIQTNQKKRDEAEFEQQRLLVQLAEKNKELEQVIYVTSHDLRSPLVNIQGFSQELGFSLQELARLLKNVDTITPELRERFVTILDEDIRESLDYIEASTSKMDGLLSGLLKLSRVDRMGSTFTSIDMNRLMKDILKAFEFQLKEIGAIVRIGELAPCFGNEMQINQVFSNLLSNALKYRDSSRPLRITISSRESDDREHILYSVEDNGIGISEQHQNRIFEIFHRLNPDDSEGEGLGLTIVTKILSRHNGKIVVESEKGTGSTFIVMLPPARSFIPEV